MNLYEKIFIEKIKFFIFFVLIEIDSTTYWFLFITACRILLFITN